MGELTIKKQNMSTFSTFSALDNMMSGIKLGELKITATHGSGKALPFFYCWTPNMLRLMKLHEGHLRVWKLERE